MEERRERSRRCVARLGKLKANRKAAQCSCRLMRLATGLDAGRCDKAQAHEARDQAPVVIAPARPTRLEMTTPGVVEPAAILCSTQ